MEEIKLQRIDTSILHEHSSLEASDYCYYLGEYASGRGFKHSKMNQVINNLKKPIDRKHSPAHNPGSKRPSISDHLINLTLDETLKEPLPRAIVIFDDVITSGASFKSAQKKLQQYFPDVPIVGIFVARNIKVEDEN